MIEEESDTGVSGLDDSFCIISTFDVDGSYRIKQIVAAPITLSEVAVGYAVQKQGICWCPMRFSDHMSFQNSL